MYRWFSYVFMSSASESLSVTVGQPVIALWCQVKAWQEQLFQQLGAETCEFLRKRGEKKMVKEKRKSKVEKEPPPQAWCCLVGCRMLVGQFLTNHNFFIFF